MHPADVDLHLLGIRPVHPADITLHLLGTRLVHQADLRQTDQTVRVTKERGKEDVIITRINGHQERPPEDLGLH